MVDVGLNFLSIAILARVLLQLFATEDSKILQFCYAATEPIVAPIRNALFRVPFFEESGLDLSYVVTVLLIMIIRLILMFF